MDVDGCRAGRGHRLREGVGLAERRGIERRGCARSATAPSSAASRTRARLRARRAPATTSPGASERPSAPSPRTARSTMPLNAPDGDESGGVQIGVRVDPHHGELRMPPRGVGDRRRARRRSRRRSTMTGLGERCELQVDELAGAPQGAEPVDAGPEGLARLQRHIRIVVQDARGRSPAIACAPSMSCIAREDGRSLPLRDDEEAGHLLIFAYAQAGSHTLRARRSRKRRTGAAPRRDRARSPEPDYGVYGAARSVDRRLRRSGAAGLQRGEARLDLGQLAHVVEAVELRVEARRGQLLLALRRAPPGGGSCLRTGRARWSGRARRST